MWKRSSQKRPLAWRKFVDLPAAVIVDQRVPVLVKALARVGMLVEGRAVEAAEAVGVGREVAGHPVDHHADPGLVAALDKVGEVLGRAVPAGRREKADGLVAPRSIEGILADRQELDVAEAQLLDVGDELVRQLVVGEVAVPLLGHAAPGGEVAFVDADGCG